MLLWLTFLFLIACGAIAPPRMARVHISSVHKLVLEHGKSANSRRTEPVPQLECVGGKAWFDTYRISRAVCTQDKQRDPVWECDAETAPGYVVRDVRVVCEGYDTKQDDYILEGSCNMKYALDHAPSNFQESMGAWGIKFILFSMMGCCGLATLVVILAGIVHFISKGKISHRLILPAQWYAQPPYRS